jgi:predicted MFS family arabinose efflux permease
MLVRVWALFGGVLASFAPLTEVFRSPALRRVELAWAGYYVAEWASFVALSVYAYGVGGAGAVGVLGLVRAAPAAVGVLAGSAMADRARRERVLLAIQSLRAVTLVAAAAAIAAGGPHWLVFLLAGLTAGVGAAYRPAQLALVPLLARTPQELVATNVSGSMLEGLAVLVGPMLAGVLLTFSGAGTVLWLAAGISAWAALLVARLSPGPYLPAGRRGPIADLAAGVRTLAEEPSPRLIIFLFASQAFVRGLLNVLLVVVAFRLLGVGESGVGFLNAAFGAGGLVGGLLGLGLVGMRRLARPFAAGLIMWGTPIGLIAAWPHAGWTYTCLAVVGIGNAILDVSGFTMIQRGIDDAVLARVFGVFEILVIVAVGAGSVLGSVLVSQLQLRGALVVAGSILPILTVLTWSRLRAVDASAVVPERELHLLQSVPLFSPLPPTTLERLAAQLSPMTAPAGTELIRQGDSGDLFYVIASGQVDVSQHGHHIAKLGPGGFFGEIALLNDVPRVATCTATTDAELYTLSRTRFVSAVTGNQTSANEIETVITNRLTELQSTTPT